MWVDERRVPGVRPRWERIPELRPELRHAATVVPSPWDHHDPRYPATGLSLTRHRRHQSIDIGCHHRDDVPSVNDDPIVTAAEERLVAGRARGPVTRPRSLDDQRCHGPARPSMSGTSSSCSPRTPATVLHVASGTPPPRPSSILLMSGCETPAAAAIFACDRRILSRAARTSRPNSRGRSRAMRAIMGPTPLHGRICKITYGVITVGDDAVCLFSEALRRARTLRGSARPPSRTPASGTRPTRSAWRPRSG